MGYVFRPHPVPPPPVVFTPETPQRTIRKATADDRHRILTIDRDAFPGESLLWEQFESRVLHDGEILLVATRRNRGAAGMPCDHITGFLLFAIEMVVGGRARAVIRRLAVAHEYRFEGVGGDLVFEALKCLPADRMPEGVVFVPEPSDRASHWLQSARFFRRLGFVARGLRGRSAIFKDHGGRGKTAWRMEFSSEE